MSVEEVPEEHHVIRYVKPTLLDGIDVDGSAFVLRQGEVGLSVYWLEIFNDLGCADPINEIRRLSRITLASTSKFAKLNVSHTKRNVTDKAAQAGVSIDLKVLQAPLPEIPGSEPDPSHSEIHGLPDYADDAAMMVGDLIAACIVPPLIPAKAS